MNHSKIVYFIFGTADLIRDTFERGTYPDVILPFTVPRRLDSVMASTRERVLARYAQLKGRLADSDGQLRLAFGFAFYTTSRSERDQMAEVFLDRKGNLLDDPRPRDHERVPLPDGDDPAEGRGVPASVQEFYDRKVRPYRPDAWIDEQKVDKKDGHVGTVGYEISFNRYFCRFGPPRALEEVERDIVALTEEIVGTLRGLTQAEVTI